MRRIISIILSVFAIAVSNQSTAKADDISLSKDKIISILISGKFTSPIDEGTSLLHVGNCLANNGTYNVVDYIYRNKISNHATQRILFIKDQSSYDGSIDVDILLSPTSIDNNRILFTNKYKGNRVSSQEFIECSAWPPKSVLIGGELLKYSK